MLRITTLTLAALALSHGASPRAQLVSVTQIADINAAPSVLGSYSGSFASDGDLAYFKGVDVESSQSFRVWRTDGTVAGTVQLSDLAINVTEAVFLPDGDVVFLGDELGVGYGLWRSDGTASGTQQLLSQQDWTVNPRDLVAFGGDAWFLAGTAANGVELWKLDAATNTVALELELVPGPGSAGSRLFGAGNTLYVADPASGLLSGTDGTLAGTVELGVFANALAGSFEHTAEVGGRAVFNIDGFGPDLGWWSSDGTPAGTQFLTGTPNQFWLVEAATKVYLTAGDAINQPRLFETDGTPGGTQPIDVPGGSGGQRVDVFTPGGAFGNTLLYGGFQEGDGIELFRTSGALGGAIQLADINPGPNWSSPSDFVEHDGLVFFRADDGVTGREIWSVDMQTGATQLLVDLTPGPFSSIVGSTPTLVDTANGVLFGKNFPEFGIEPGIADAQGAGLLLNIAPDGDSDGSNPAQYARLGSNVLFAATDDALGTELFITDGTAGGTSLLANIDPTDSGFDGSFPRNFTTWGDRAYFFASHPVTGNELWSTDGTPEGTQIVVDLVPGPLGTEPFLSAPPVILGDALYFIGKDPSNDFSLFRTDGTAAGTTKVITTDPSGLFTEFVRIFVVGERIVFWANAGDTGAELWTSDGTAEGTSVLVDMTPGPGDSVITEFDSDGEQAFVSVRLGTDVNTLWKTDGTTAGTTQFLSQPSGLVFGPGPMELLGDGIVFLFDDGVHGYEPWISDGTEAGTRLLLDVVPGPDSSGIQDLTVAGGRLFFSADDPDAFGHNQRLWTSDGTAAGTQLVATLPSPIAGPGIGNLWALGDDERILFTNVDDNGNEWWLSDGTTAGTAPFSDIAPGGAFASPRPGVLVNERLVFRANNGLDGDELHAVDLAATGAFAATSLGIGCAGSNGAPELDLSSGAVAAGESFELGIQSAAGGALAVWAFDTELGPLAAPGTCAVQLPDAKLLATTLTDPEGSSSLQAAIADDVTLVGLRFDIQAVSVEVGGPFLGVGATSDVLELVIGD